MAIQVIGVDLGGTAIKVGCFTARGECLETTTVPTPNPPTLDAVVTAISAAIKQVDPDGTCAAIGVGTPGHVDQTGRIVKTAINLAGWQNMPLAQALEERLRCPVALANDANCAGLGESWLGAGQQFQNLILLTLGTGVGGAVILNGQLFTGRLGTGAELGLITLNFEGPPCNSGNRGSLEQYVSAQAIRRRTGREPDQLAELAGQGERAAVEFWQQYGRELGAGLASLIYIFTPEAVILGGGISAGLSLFQAEVAATIADRVLPSCREGLKVLPAALGNQAGIVGAAKLALDKLILS